MERIAELKVTVAKMEVLARKSTTDGITRHALLLTKRSDDVVTDRLVVTDEAVRILSLGR
jgi:hypothetical protein